MRIDIHRATERKEMKSVEEELFIIRSKIPAYDCSGRNSKLVWLYLLLTLTIENTTNSFDYIISVTFELKCGRTCFVTVQ